MVREAILKSISAGDVATSVPNAGTVSRHTGIHISTVSSDIIMVHSTIFPWGMKSQTVVFPLNIASHVSQTPQYWQGLGRSRGLPLQHHSDCSVVGTLGCPHIPGEVLQLSRGVMEACSSLPNLLCGCKKALIKLPV